MSDVNGKLAAMRASAVQETYSANEQADTVLALLAAVEAVLALHQESTIGYHCRNCWYSLSLKHGELCPVAEAKQWIDAAAIREAGD